jgi:hypothetical protein
MTIEDEPMLRLRKDDEAVDRVAAVIFFSAYLATYLS